MQFNLNVTPVTLLNFGGTAQKEIEICFQSWWRVVSNLGLIHMMCSVLSDVMLLVLVLFLINVELKLLYCCLFPLNSEQKWDQPRHDACCFVTTNSASPPL